MLPYSRFGSRFATQGSASHRGRRKPRAAQEAAVERLEDRRLLSATAGPVIDLTGLRIDQASYAQDHILVRFKDGVAPAGVVGREIAPGTGVWAVGLGEGETVAGAVSEFSARPDVAYAEPDYVVRSAAWFDTDAAGDDPIRDYFYAVGELWGLNNNGKDLTYTGSPSTAGKADADIDAPAAWTVTTGDMGVSVAVIDSGVDYTHPDLYLNVWINQGEISATVRSGVIDADADGLVTFRDLNDPLNAGSAFTKDLNNNGYVDGGDLRLMTAWFDGADTDANGYRDDLFGWNFSAGNNNPMDDHGHGTHVAGTIGASVNNDQDGDGKRLDAKSVVGVAWDVSLMGLKFLNSYGSGLQSGAAAALKYAADMGAKVSNNSWGMPESGRILRDALEYAASKGQLIVAAAGNDGAAIEADYPANSTYVLPQLIKVAATTYQDRLASFSNYGSWVDLAAPGERIWSTVPINLDTADGTKEGLNRKDGTSMAAPHVAGTAALMLAVNPKLTAAQLKSLLTSTTDVVTSADGSVTYIGPGAAKPTAAGRLNAGRAVAAAVAETVKSTGQMLAISDATAVEGGRAVFQVARSGDASGKVRVYFSVRSGTATEGDFAVVGEGFRDIEAGSASGTFEVDFIQDDLLEANETFLVTIDRVTTVAVDAATGLEAEAALPTEAILRGTGRGTILNDDGGPLTVTRTYGLTEAAGVIPDAGQGTFRSTIAVADLFAIADVNVSVRINHPNAADLDVFLIAPNGTRIELFTDVGGTGDHFGTDVVWTTLDDEASASVAAGKAPFAGVYRPEGRLNVMDGLPSNGNWTLEIVDDYKRNVGRVIGWSIALRPALPGAPPAPPATTYTAAVLPVATGSSSTAGGDATTSLGSGFETGAAEIAEVPGLVIAFSAFQSGDAPTTWQGGRDEDSRDDGRVGAASEADVRERAEIDLLLAGLGELLDELLAA